MYIKTLSTVLIARKKVQLYFFFSCWDNIVSFFFFLCTPWENWEGKLFPADSRHILFYFFDSFHTDPSGIFTIWINYYYYAILYTYTFTFQKALSLFVRSQAMEVSRRCRKLEEKGALVPPTTALPLTITHLWITWIITMLPLLKETSPIQLNRSAENTRHQRKALLNCSRPLMIFWIVLIFFRLVARPKVQIFNLTLAPIVPIQYHFIYVVLKRYGSLFISSLLAA